jgi:hypothetical protein
MKDKITDYKQIAWLNKKAKDQFTFEPVSQLTTTACLMLLLAGGTEAFGEIPQENEFVSLNNTLLGNNNVCPAPQKSVAAGSSQKGNFFMPLDIAISSTPLPKNKKPEKTASAENHPNGALQLSKYYSKYFNSVPVDEIPVEINLGAFSIMAMASEEAKLANTLQERIKLLLPQLPINPELFAVLKRTNLKVVVAPRSALIEKINVHPDSITPQDIIYGTYLPLCNTVYVSIEIVHLDDWGLVRVLLNEFHSALVTIRNFLRLEKDILPELKREEIFVYPFVDKTGGIDRRQMKRLTRATEEFKSNVKKFIEIYNKQEDQKALTSEETLFFNKGAQLIKAHHIASPHMQISITSSQYKTAKQLGGIMSYRDGSVRMNKDLFGGIADIHAYFFGISGEFKVGFYNFAHPGDKQSRIIAFIENMKLLEHTYNEARHEGTVYGKKEKESKLAEFSSDIEMLSPELKQFFAPLWCKFFAQYHGVREYLGKDYPTQSTDDRGMQLKL